MIVTDDPKIAALCRCLRNQGRDENSQWLCHARLGYNYRLSDVHAALGSAQLERANQLLAARERVAELYSREMQGIPGVILPSACSSLKRSWFAYVIQLSGPAASETRERLIAGLQERGIASQAYFPAIHRQPYFQNVRVIPRRPLPHTEAASANCIALPFFSSITEEEVSRVCASVREILAKEDVVSGLMAEQTAPVETAPWSAA